MLRLLSYITITFIILLAFPSSHSRAHKSSKETKAVTSVEYDRLLVDRAVKICKNVRNKNIDMARRNAHRLLEVEKNVGIPMLMYGMTLAAACSESGFSESAKGDHRFSKKRKPKAIGVLQLWPWVKKYGVDRMNLESSADFWLRHIVRQHRSIKRRCKPRTKLKAWRQAWVTAIRAPKKTGRCNETPKHWRMFLKLQKFQRTLTIKASNKLGNVDGHKETN